MLLADVEQMFKKSELEQLFQLGGGVPPGRFGGVTGVRPHPAPFDVRAQPILAAQESGLVHTQPLSFPIRLPDALQAEALRLLDASRAAINELLVELWPQLDRFAAERTGPAWKQVEQYVTKRSGHGRRPRAL
jgi:hypothetical protein